MCAVKVCVRIDAVGPWRGAARTVVRADAMHELVHELFDAERRGMRDMRRVLCAALVAVALIRCIAAPWRAFAALVSACSTARRQRAHEYEAFGVGAVFIRPGSVRPCFAQNASVTVTRPMPKRAGARERWMFAVPNVHHRFALGRTVCFGTHRGALARVMNRSAVSKLCGEHARDDDCGLDLLFGAMRAEGFDSVQFTEHFEPSDARNWRLWKRGCHNPTLTEIVDLQRASSKVERGSA